MRTTFKDLGAAAIVIAALAACGGDATSPPGPPAKLQLVSSSSITATVGDTIVTPVLVDVRDAAGRGVPNMPVVAWGVVGIPLADGKTYSVVAVDSIVLTDDRGRATIRMIAPTAAADTGTIYVGLGQGAGPSSNVLGLTIHIATKAGPFAQLVPHRTQRFAGATFAIDSLFTPADRFGNPVSVPAMQVTASDGWQVSGNTLAPPSATYTGTAIVSVVASGVSGSDTVSVVEDLRAYHWSMQGSCVPATAQVAAGAPDSIIYDGTNGRAYYGGDVGYAPLFDKTGNTHQPVVEFYFTGTSTSYKGGIATTSGIMAAEPYGFDAFVQRPDTLVFGTGTYASTFVRVPGTVPSYVHDTNGLRASSGCLGQSARPLTLQAY